MDYETLEEKIPVSHSSPNSRPPYKTRESTQSRLARFKCSPKDKKKIITRKFKYSGIDTLWTQSRACIICHGPLFSPACRSFQQNGTTENSPNFGISLSPHCVFFISFVSSKLLNLDPWIKANKTKSGRRHDQNIKRTSWQLVGKGRDANVIFQPTFPVNWKKNYYPVFGSVFT